ncbi:hypothetical protein [Vibrio tasmaniensis]|uniref:hypothetical protein n=1 Tax=Vibrio tasmaniensis TaxID=212663 RepID=UPI00107F7234|nr:hypothetical protein [Vibrio tasmaniensis]
MKVILHLGFPKTGSSTLQYGLFKPLHEQGELILRTWRQESEHEHHDRRPSSCLFRRQPIPDEYLCFSYSKLNILSDESFTAPVKLRRNNYGDDIVDPSCFPELIRKQIVEKYGDSVDIEVFITIRRQDEQIYSQYVEEYNLKRYKNVDLVFREDGEVDVSGFDIYKYDSYIDILEHVYSPEKVHVTLFEDWKVSSSNFSSELSKIFDIPKPYIEQQLNNNHVNKKVKNSEGYYTKDGQIFIPKFSVDQMKSIREYFREDNIRLKNRLGHKHDLSKLGYL